MTTAIQTPRLLFVTGSTSGIEEYFYLSAVEPWVKALALHFEVAVVQSAAALEPEAARFQPDLLLFFGAKYKLLYDGPVCDFRNRFGIPVAALTLMDGHSPAKQPFFEHAWRLGVEAVFSIDTGMREMAGEFASSVFYCPWFVNEEMCRDFGEKKDIPIALVGDGFVSSGSDWRYPWRRNVTAQLRKSFPVFTSPRPTGAYPHRMVGEAYGRMLNRSWMALSCGASRHIFMKKNLEIPASRCCLVTEPNASLLHLGFRDMENCVFATADTVVEKCRALLENETELWALTDRGRSFVLRQHGARNRRVIADWLTLRLAMEPGDRIVQPDVLAPLRLVKSDGTNGDSICLSTGSPFINAMREAEQAYLRGDRAGCRKPAEFAASMLPYTPEPSLLLSLQAFAENNPREALLLLSVALKRAMYWEGENADPVAWALYLLALNLAGFSSEARLMMDCFPHLNHPVLNAVRHAVSGTVNTPLPTESGDTLSTPSVFTLPWSTPSQTAEFWLPLLEQAQQNRDAGSQPAASGHAT